MYFLFRLLIIACGIASGAAAFAQDHPCPAMVDHVLTSLGMGTFDSPAATTSKVFTKFSRHDFYQFKRGEPSDPSGPLSVMTSVTVIPFDPRFNRSVDVLETLRGRRDEPGRSESTLHFDSACRFLRIEVRLVTAQGTSSSTIDVEGCRSRPSHPPESEGHSLQVRSAAWVHAFCQRLSDAGLLETKPETQSVQPSSQPAGPIGSERSLVPASAR